MPDSEELADNPRTSTPPPPYQEEPTAEAQSAQNTDDADGDVAATSDIDRAGDLLVLDSTGQSRPFRDIYSGPGRAKRQLIIFVRHFFCGNCQEYLRTLSSSIRPEALLSLRDPAFITVIGCGRPELIEMYANTTSCPFPIYADPTRKVYEALGLPRTLYLGSKPEYIQNSLVAGAAQSIVQGIMTGTGALKGGDYKQVGGEFLFEDGNLIWSHRMKTTRDHAEVTELRRLLGLEEEPTPLRRSRTTLKTLGRRASTAGKPPT